MYFFWWQKEADEFLFRYKGIFIGEGALIRSKTAFLLSFFSDQQISFTLQQSILVAFQNYLNYVLPLIGKNPAMAQIPVKVGPIVFLHGLTL